MSVNPSPIGGFAAQFFDNNGQPLSGGKIYTYAAGTTTPQATYTSATGVTPHANPIVLDSAGRVPGGEIWLTDSLIYKFVIETSTAILIGTYDNITGVNSNFVNYTIQEEVITATAGQTVFNLTTINYTPGTNSLSVYIDGVNQYVGDSYLETDSNTVTFTAGLHVGAEVKFTTAVQTTTGAVDASIVSYDPPFTGGIPTTVEDKLAQYVSVKDFGAIGDGVANDTAAIQAAVDTGKRVYIPAGTYKCNVEINNKTIIEGDGSLATILKPFNDAIAVLTYTFTAQQNPIYRFWDYHSEVRNVGFFSNTAKVGVGFTFGATTAAGYTAGDEYANNVKFYGCYFEGLEKGIQFPFGNIGTEIYSCGFADNYYGIYNVNNRFGDPMQAGCKYVYGGEFHGNECAIYLNNDPTAVVFNGTIFEFNQIAVYAYTAALTVVPVVFNDCWFEGNGVSNSGSVATTVVLDVWTGTVKSTTTVFRHAIYTEGTKGQFVFNRSFFTDAYIDSANTLVTVNDSRVEDQSGYGGGACTVTDPSTSSIVINNPYTAGSVPRSQGVVADGRITFSNSTIDGAVSFSQSRWCFVNARANKVDDIGIPFANAINFETPVELGAGAFTLTGTMVNDGQLFQYCNEYNRTSFASSEFVRPISPSGAFTTTAGWYVYSFDAKRIFADVRFNVWDRSTAQLATGISLPTIGDWYTVAGMGYSPGGQTMYLDFQGVNQTATWRVSAWQVLRFDTQEQAQAYLISRAYANPSNNTVATTSGVAAKIMSCPTQKLATYLVSADIPVSDAANYSAISLISVNGNSVRATALQTAALLTISVSGQDVNVTQSSGGAATVQFSIKKLSSIQG